MPALAPLVWSPGAGGMVSTHEAGAWRHLTGGSTAVVASVAEGAFWIRLATHLADLKEATGAHVCRQHEIATADNQKHSKRAGQVAQAAEIC